jgi:hypothetical protein
LSLRIMSENQGEVMAKLYNCRSIRVSGDHIGHAPVLIKGSWSIAEVG